ncbi:MAG: DUF1800 domain-containing protein [Proteobacteria bacterium]|nr:DUF1800 domain-containing protein [Pseudomonadota bacterium]
MFSPLPQKLWDRTRAAHLLNRAGFGGTPVEIEKLHAMGPSGSVDFFLMTEPDDELFPPPELFEPEPRFQLTKRVKEAVTEVDRKNLYKDLRRADRLSMLDLRLWWLNRMRYTTAPLREKVTLFWHGHFATSYQKVLDAWMMWVQNETFRQQGMGKFPVLLKSISRDPAMIRWLDLFQNRKNHPNENFAREVMELFSLGEGHYTEQDIQQAAKSFTGYRIVPETGSFRFFPNQYDSGSKTFFGKTGPFTGDDIIDLITAQPQCARFIGKKLWTFFVATDPTEETVTGLGELLLSNGYDIAATLRVIFRSEDFYSPHVMHHQIKSPVQWMIQTTRMLEIPLPDAKVLENSLASLGQVLFEPPNVKGWDGGRSWISASSLLYRYNLASYLLSGKARVLGGYGTKTAEVPLSTIVPVSARSTPGDLIDLLAFRIFNYQLLDKDRASYFAFLEKKPVPYTDPIVKDLMQIMMGTPYYQMT